MSLTRTHREDTVDFVSRDVRTWLRECDLPTQQSAIGRVVSMFSPEVRAQLSSVLQPLLGKDMEYTLSLKHQRDFLLEVSRRQGAFPSISLSRLNTNDVSLPRIQVRKSDSPSTLERTEVRRAWSATSPPPAHHHYERLIHTASRESFGWTNRGVDRRRHQKRTSMPSLQDLPVTSHRRPPGTSPSLATSERREPTLYAGAHPPATTPASALHMTSQHGIRGCDASPSQSSRRRRRAGSPASGALHRLLHWVESDADALAQLLLFKQLMPCCALPSLYALEEQLRLDADAPATAVAPAATTRRPRESFDILMALPVHLAKRILMHLDFVELETTKSVCRGWRQISEEVGRDKEHRQDADDFLLDLKAVADPHYSGAVDIPVWRPSSADPTTVVQTVESTFEQNIFCGTFSVITFPEAAHDAQRCAHYAGGTHVVTGGANKQARVWHAQSGTLVRSLHGHAGSVHAVHVDDARGFMLTASYDTSVRRWNLRTGRCEAIYGGAHKRTVRCLAVDPAARLLVSGGNDHVVALWTLQAPAAPSPPGALQQEASPQRGRDDSVPPAAAVASPPQVPEFEKGTRDVGRGSSTRHRHTFVHDGRIRCVGLHSHRPRHDHPLVSRGASGTDTGTLTYYDTRLGVVLKSIRHAHKGPITCLALDANFLYTGGMDRFVYVRSTANGHDAPKKFLRHTSEVLALGLLTQRLVTGTHDGKIRIWSLPTAECIRIFRGNSACDPVVGVSFADNRSICINTSTSMHVLFFAPAGDSDGNTHAPSEGAATTVTASPRATALPRCKTKTADIPTAPSLRTLRTRVVPTTPHLFSGHWRSDPLALAASKHAP
eukprot:m.15575 g.15575  ORF g.15575 m.15575 type:complete len:835 (-) comp10777_c0_seq3:160-2664(-)